MHKPDGSTQTMKSKEVETRGVGCYSWFQHSSTW